MNPAENDLADTSPDDLPSTSGLTSYAALIRLIEILPELVLETRRRRDLSQRAAGELMGMANSTVARFEQTGSASSDLLIEFLRFVADLPPRSARNGNGTTAH